MAHFTRSQKEEAFAFWHDRFRFHRRRGLTRAQARKAASADGEKKYGAVDWKALLTLILPLILKLLGL